MARRALLLFAVAALLFVAGCAALGPEPQATPEEQRAYSAAESQLAKNRAAGRAALAKFLKQYPDAPLANTARVKLGDAALADGDVAGAQSVLNEVVTRAPRSPEADRARVRLARIAADKNDDRTARDLLTRVRLARLPVPDRVDAYRALADSAESGADRVLWLSKLRKELPDAKAADAIDVEVEMSLARLEQPELVRLGRELGNDPPAASVALALAERELEAGEVDAARRALSRAESLPLAPAQSDRLTSLRERLDAQSVARESGAPVPEFEAAERSGLPETAGARGALGVVLPLSGPYAPFGEESLRGVLLAAGVFGAADAQAPELRIVVRDSQGQAAQAAAAVRELAADDEIAAIVGPLLSGECEAAAAAAQELRVPLLTLTAREEIVRGRDYVFRLRTRPAEETALLVDHARALGASRFAILYRDDAYGRGLRGLFWDAVESRGGRVVAVSSYPPDAKDFAEPIRRLVGYSLLDDDERALIARRESILQKARRLPPTEALALRSEAQSIRRADGAPLPPIVDFDALFVPETAEGLVLIAPHLAFHEVIGARLLGPDGSYGPDVVRLAGEHIEGALFVSHFFAQSPIPYVHEFSERYRQSFGTEPAVFAAQSYDAANLVLVQLAHRRSARDAVRDGILGVSGYPGVAGVLSMDPDGNARKRPFLLQVEHGKIEQVE
jgi:ABC-type branched-subunit amino acid transport system substrate-binding protein/predicted negative regulator of RcsB-dependent stress response